jgi:hypothetical protein
VGAVCVAKIRQRARIESAVLRAFVTIGNLGISGPGVRCLTEEYSV